LKGKRGGEGGGKRKTVREEAWRKGGQMEIRSEMGRREGKNE